jgi:hypothetical protein
VSTLQVEMTGAWEAATNMEAARAVAVLAVEISSREAVVTGDSTAILIKDVDDWSTLAERVSRGEEESSATLASAREEAKGLLQKITLLKGELAEVLQA